MQPEISLNLLKALKEKSIDTTVDTCGFAKWEILESILPYTDRFLFDLKHLDPDIHFRDTGVNNNLILENLEKLINNGSAAVWIRIPVITGFNDSEEYFQQLGEYLRGKKIEKLSLLTYHKWGTPKYDYLGKEYLWSREAEVSEEEVNKYKQIIENKGVSVTIGF